jgi:hypothetical protein
MQHRRNAPPAFAQIICTQFAPLSPPWVALARMTRTGLPRKRSRRRIVQSPFRRSSEIGVAAYLKPATRALLIVTVNA